jgi:hypothetical protein
MLITGRDLIHEQSKMRTRTLALLHYNELWQEPSDALYSYQGSPERGDDLFDLPVSMLDKVSAVPEALHEHTEREELHGADLY